VRAILFEVSAFGLRLWTQRLKADRRLNHQSPCRGLGPNQANELLSRLAGAGIELVVVAASISGPESRPSLKPLPRARYPPRQREALDEA
jgi:hypothetical protein